MHKNRRPRPATSLRYTGAMLRGEWQDNAETIKFNGDGTLIDGQHRCESIVAVGQTNPDFSIDLWIARGLTDEARTTLDTGAKRTIADEFAIRGIPRANAVAGAISVLWRYNEGVAGGEAPTTPAALELLDANPALHDSLTPGSEMSEACGGLVSASTASAAHYLMTQIDSERAVAFTEAFISGANLEPGDPVLKLTKYLAKIGIDRRNGTLAGRGAQRSLLATIIQAWNGETRFGLKRGQPFPTFAD